MSTNLQELVGQLTGTMSPDAQARNAATQYLKAHEQAPDLAVSLLQVLAEGSVDLAVKQAAAIYFKNLIMREWVSDTDVERIDVTSKNTIKVHIVQLMLVAPKLVQAQLSQALAIISQADFPSHWEQLLPELVSKLAQGDPDINVGVLETAHSIFHRYRYEVKSQALWEEIKYVLGVFQGPVTQIFQQTVEQLRTPNQPLALQLQLFKALHLEVEIFFSLNSQDLPEFFEDNMKLWFGNFQHFLQYSNPALAPNKDDAAGPVEEVQAAICEAINLYTNKYEEEFKEWVPVFVQEAWNLLTRLDEQERYDTLATTAIRFLTSVVKKDWNKELFNNEAALKTICEKVVIPQLKLRESDVEMFTMNGLEFIRRDIEGSDIDTRRRTTVDFVQGLCHHFEAEITEILKNYVGVLLAEYKANPKDKWVAKDAAMYIVLALSVKKQTRQAGATVANPYVDLLSFLQSEVLPELKASDVNNLPILKADCLKFVSTFRFLLPADAYPVLLPLVTRHLASEEFVVHTYAAAAIERLLSIKDGGVPKCGKETIKPVLQEMLTGLFSVLEMEESKENSYVMKCIMRVCAVAEETIAPYANIILGKLCAVLGHVAQNPTNPQFNHYLFETLACLVAHLCKLDPSAVNQFETALFPPFQTMLGMETCQEFGPYVFQILSQLLEKRPDVSETYKAVFPSLLSPTLWDNHGNVPAIIRLLTAYLTKAGGPAAVVTPDRLVGLLGIFQKLNASKKLDHHAFALLTTLVETQPMTVLAPYLTEIFKLIFSRLQPQSRTTKYSKGLVVFISFFMHTHGLAALLTAMDQIQPKIFSMILDKVWPAGTAAVTGDEERITVVAGLTRAIFASPELLEAPYMTSLPGVLSGLVALVEEQQGEGESGEEDLLDVSDKGFSTAMARLAYAPEPVKESVATPGGTSAKELFIRNFSSAMSHHREKFQGLIGQLDQEKRNILSAYLSQPVTVG